MLSVFEAQRPSSQYQRGVLVDLVHPLQSHLDVRSRLTNQDGSIERLDSRLLPQRDFISASGHQDVIPGRANQIFDSVCRLCRPMIRYSKFCVNGPISLLEPSMSIQQGCEVVAYHSNHPRSSPLPHNLEIVNALRSYPQRHFGVC